MWAVSEATWMPFLTIVSNVSLYFSLTAPVTVVSWVASHFSSTAPLTCTKAVPLATSWLKLPSLTVTLVSFLIVSVCLPSTAIVRSFFTVCVSSCLTSVVMSYSAWAVSCSFPLVSLARNPLKFDGAPLGVERDCSPLTIPSLGRLLGGIWSAL